MKWTMATACRMNPHQETKKKSSDPMECAIYHGAFFAGRWAGLSKVRDRLEARPLSSNHAPRIDR
jgi:hypothetical protein